MKMRSFAFGFALLPALLTSCASTSSWRTPSSSGGVTVYLPGQADKTIQRPEQNFAITKLDDKDAVESLRQFLLAHKSDLAVKVPAELDLRAVGVYGAGGMVSVRFEQQLGRHVNQQDGYDIPISGAGVVAIVKDGKLDSLNSTLENPPSVSFIWKNPGFDLSGFDDLAIKALLIHLRSAPPEAHVADYFAKAAKNSGLSFDLARFNKMDFPAQKMTLQNFFGKLGPVTTFKALIDLARHRRLALVRYGDTWMYEVTGFFNIPVSFDMEIPADQASRLKLRNYRELAHAISVNVMTYPNYPNGPGSWAAQLASVETGSVDRSSAGGATAGMFQDAARYFEKYFRWYGYNGQDPNLVINVYKGLTVPLWAENAAWVGGQGHFIIGAGGSTLTGFDRSISTMGHEYAHAITQYTSGLVYRGETGALNEHFSDIQGVSLQAEARGQPFNYMIGDDLLTDQMRKVKTLLIALDAASIKADVNEFQKYNVFTPSLRNLYRPRESFNAQPESVAEGNNLGYGAGCQPSQNNDQCGVHTLSGIPNRAVAIIISKLGLERTRNMIFRTNTMRLNAASDFQDYARQMLAECKSGGELDPGAECSIVWDAFHTVGINLPDGSVPQPPRPAPNPEPAPQPQPQPQPAPQSPVLEFCGWVDVAQTGSGNVTIIDNKFDAAILVSKNYPRLTQGNFQDIYNWRGNPHPCGCVWGRLSQTPNSKGTIFNFFLNITKMQQGRPQDCINDKIIFK